MSFESIKPILVVVFLATQMLWLARIFRGSLSRQYPALFGYLVLGCIALPTGVLLRDVGGVELYKWYHAVSRPLAWALFFAILYECYGRMVADYAGVKRIGKLVMYGAFGSVFALAALLVVTDPYAATHANYWYKATLIHEQSVYLAAALCVFVLLLFRRFFRLPIAKNVRVVFGVFGFYFAGMAALIVLRSYVGQELNNVLNLGGLLLSTACPAVGALLFSRAGEETATDARLDMAATRASEIKDAMGRLDHVNDQLMRALAK